MVNGCKDLVVVQHLLNVAVDLLFVANHVGSAVRAATFLNEVCCSKQAEGKQESYLETIPTQALLHTAHM